MTEETVHVNLGDLFLGLLMLGVPMLVLGFLTVAAIVVVTDRMYKVRGWLVFLVAGLIAVIGTCLILTYVGGMMGGDPSYMDRHFPIVEEIPTTTIEEG